MNSSFIALEIDELQETDGGLVVAIATVVGAIATVGCLAYTAYESAKSDAYDTGKQVAYQDLYNGK